jgi:S-formylglutathione hydrolase FrmB
MVLEDVPRWCAARGFDTGRLVAWGWSMGGFGALLLAQSRPGFVRAVAAFSPAVSAGDAVSAGVDRLRGTRIGLWCGTADGLYADVRALQRRLPEPAAVAAYDKGAHTRGYWNRITPAGFDFLAGALT